MTHAELRAAGYDLDEQAYSLLSRYVELLLEKNRQLNLISRRSADDIWVAHICDSLALLPLLDEVFSPGCSSEKSRPQRLVDVGSGGGLPGVVLACARPQLDVTLIEATGKKVSAVKQIVEQAGICNVSCVWGRAEQLGGQSAFREQFDLLTARAVGQLRELVGYAGLLLRPGGLAYFYKTPLRAAAEQSRATRAARRWGLEWMRTWSYTLPARQVTHVIVVYRRKAA
jgi:16S rRNA (guanine527-N7)-methyltransferase